MNNTLYVQSKDGVIRLAIEMGDDQVPELEIIKPASQKRMEGIMPYLYVLHHGSYGSQKWCTTSSEDEYAVIGIFNAFPVNDAFDLFITQKVDATYWEVESEIGEVYILQRFGITDGKVIDLETV